MSCMMQRALPEEIVRAAVDCGMDAIDWVCNWKYAPARELRALSSDNGLKIIAHTVLDSTFVKRDPNALDDFKRSLEFACALGGAVSKGINTVGDYASCAEILPYSV